MHSNKLKQSPQVSWLARPPRWLLVCGLLVICGLAFGLRYLHLLNDDHYFIISADSHYFHRMAQLLVEGETFFYPTHGRVLPIEMFSGITYPLAAISNALALLTPASSADTLEIASKLLPPTLGVTTILLLYFAVSRLYGPMAGLFSAFAWAVVPWGIMHQAAGYLDRDCLSLLLVTGGVFAFYFLSTAQPSIGLGRFKWVAFVLAVAAIQFLLYIQWGFMGPVILLAILVGFFLLYILTNLMVRVVPFALREQDPVGMFLTFLKGSLRALPGVLKGPLSWPIALILVLNLAVVAFRPALFRSIYNAAISVFTGSPAGEEFVAELRGLDLEHLLSFSFLLIPALIGIYVCARRRNRADLLLLAWFAVLFVAGLFAVRLFIYATPAVCILSAIGFIALLDVKGFRPSLAALPMLLFVDPRGLVPYLRIGSVAIIIILTLFASISFGYSFASSPPTAADNEWHDALLWLRDRTDHDAVIMTWWDRGYWIFDIAQRVPVVDNGRHPAHTDVDIARVYCAFDDSEAVSIMTHYGADYLVFSKVEIDILPVISRRALNEAYGDRVSIPPELRDSLYARSLAHTFDSDSGLERVYQSPDSSVVILKLG